MPHSPLQPDYDRLRNVKNITLNGMASVELIEYSINSRGERIASLECIYPRYIHGEVMTHRVFSRNGASSRAIPVADNVSRVLTDPVVPLFFGKNQRGMQAEESVSEDVEKELRARWENLSRVVANECAEWDKLGLHKELCNRPMEAWSWMKTLITATDFDNFFELRHNGDATREIQNLSKGIDYLISSREPRLLKKGEWHLPYVTEAERKKYPLEDLLKVSTARCARTSYLLHKGGSPTLEKDIALYEDLVGSRPLHASPAEHQATPDHTFLRPIRKIFNGKSPYCGNLNGWLQHRKFIEEKLWK